MSDTSFGLGGLSVRDAYQDRPQMVERGGWLCEFDVLERDLTKAEYRMLRLDGGGQAGVAFGVTSEVCGFSP